VAISLFGQVIENWSIGPKVRVTNFHGKIYVKILTKMGLATSWAIFS
jgi:hypothetical protein